ncbi:MAG: GNAT family N-acetyltransferase [Pricia sp.]
MVISRATKKDIHAIVGMIADDQLGRLREDFDDPLPENYYKAFDEIDSAPDQELMVMKTEGGQVVGTLQLSFIRYLTYQGGLRTQIEAVRVHRDYRARGIGQKLFEWAIGRAREKEAHVVQLTTDKKRPKALKFYEKLGFKASHEGMKLHL